MIQPLFPSYQLPQGGVSLNYFNISSYCEDLQEQIKNIQKNCDTLKQENDLLKNKLNQLKQSQDFRTDDKKLIVKKKKRQRRRSIDNIEKNFKCSFQDCEKEYASDLALNLHIKNKHNGGTKTMRQQLAVSYKFIQKQIVLAEQKGTCLPKININFPPGYIKQFRKQFFNQY